MEEDLSLRGRRLLEWLNSIAIDKFDPRKNSTNVQNRSMTPKVSMLESFLSFQSDHCHSHWDRLHSKSLSACSSLLRRRPVDDIAVLTTPFLREVDRSFDEDEHRSRFSRQRWTNTSRRESFVLPLWDVSRLSLDRVDFDRVDELDDRSLSCSDVRFDGLSKDWKTPRWKDRHGSNFVVVVLDWWIDLRLLFEIASVEHLSKIRFHRSKREIDGWMDLPCVFLLEFLLHLFA